MTYKRTAVLKSGCGGVSLRSFVSEKALTYDIVMNLLKESGVKDREQILIYDTPEAEEVKPTIVVQVAECTGVLYMGLSEDGAWSTFWQIDESITRDNIIGFMVSVHKQGRINRCTSENPSWRGEISELTPVITFDGKQVVILVDKMGSNVKRCLDL